MSAAALLEGHRRVLRDADSFTVTNNGTNRYAGNGSVARRLESVREFDLADGRWYVSQHAVSPDGTVTGGSERFVNGSSACSRFDGEVRCSEGQASRQRAIGLSVEATSLETIGGPAFEPAGTVRQNGSQFYRYTADELRADVPEGAARELGENATLRSATLLVTPGGRIAEYRVTYGPDAGPVRGVIERVYRTTAVNDTEPRRPDWVPAE
ncbi:MAG: hypothetical protein ABEJ89_06280 [Haloarculaceae archaeon]